MSGRFSEKSDSPMDSAAPAALHLPEPRRRVRRPMRGARLRSHGRGAWVATPSTRSASGGRARAHGAWAQGARVASARARFPAPSARRDLRGEGARGRRKPGSWHRGTSSAVSLGHLRRGSAPSPEHEGCVCGGIHSRAALTQVKLEESRPKSRDVWRYRPTMARHPPKWGGIMMRHRCACGKIGLRWLETSHDGTNVDKFGGAGGWVGGVWGL